MGRKSFWSWVSGVPKCALSTDFLQRFGGDGERASRIVFKGIGLGQFRRLGGRGAVRCHYDPPVRVVPTYILENESLRLMKEKDAAQHVVFADIVNEVRSGAGIPDGDAEMMIPETSVLPQVGLGSGK